MSSRIIFISRMQEALGDITAAASLIYSFVGTIINRSHYNDAIESKRVAHFDILFTFKRLIIAVTREYP